MRASPSAYPTLSPGTKSPSHLVLRNGTWHFRMAVSTPCRPHLGGLSEFKASLRTGVLREAKLVIEEWRRSYNDVRPHSSLGNMTPGAYVQMIGNTSTQGAALKN